MDENQKDDIFIQKPHVIKKNVFEPDADENMQFQSQATELLSARNAFALRDELRNASYIVKKGKRGTRTDHSITMKAVIEKLDAVQKAMSWQVSKDKEMFEAQLGSLNSALKEVLYACDDYLDCHTNPHRTEGKVRKQYILQIRELVKNDTAMLTARAQTYYETEIEKKGNQENKLLLEDKRVTWLSIFASARREEITEGDGVFVNEGGDLGTGMLIVTQKDGTKRYLKADEPMTEHSMGMTVTVVNKRIDNKLAYLKSAPQNEETQKEIQSLTRQREYIELFKSSLALNRGSSYLTKGKIGQVKGVFIDNLRRNRKDDAAINQIIGRLGLTGSPFAQAFSSLLLQKENAYNEKQKKSKKYGQLQTELRKLEQDTEAYQKKKNESDTVFNEAMDLEQGYWEAVNTITDMSKAMELLGRQLNADDMAHKVAQVGSTGSSYAKRNVATYRLAKYLGLGDIVAKAELKEVKIKGVSGIFMEMEQVPGISSELASSPVSEVKTFQYSLNAVEKLASLQVFDIICGQVDRHRNNYLVTTKETKRPGKTPLVTMEDVKAIDNDLSHGMLTYEEIKENQLYQQIRSIEDKDGNMRIPAMSDTLATAIENLTPGMVDYLLIDLLTRSELAALKARIKGVQNAIKRQRERESKGKHVGPSFFAKTQKDWLRVRNEIESMAGDEILDEQAFRYDRHQGLDVAHEGKLHNSSYYHANWLNVKRRDSSFIDPPKPSDDDDDE